MAMAVDQHYLRSLLQSDSSRVFNCGNVAKKLLEEGDSAPLLFKTPGMNFSVIFKEAIVEVTARRDRRHNLVGTKLLFPTDTHFAIAGERSIYLHDPGLPPLMREVLGAGGRSDRAGIEHDLSILAILDRLPSFDAFLTRDALENAGIAPNPRYFPMPDAEQKGIREFIRRKFDPLVRLALGQSAPASKSMLLVNKIWEANDALALAPLAQAFRFPPQEALAIFSAWKGINVYGFRYVQAKPKREAFALWLRDQAKPRDFALDGMSSYIDLLRRDVVTNLRHHWRVAEEITREHDRLYGELLRAHQAISPFLTFLRHSRVLCSRMGLSLSKIDHAVGAWKMAMETYPLGIMPVDDLRVLLLLLHEILIVDNLGDSETYPLTKAG